MNKKELIESIAKETKGTQKDTEAFVKAFQKIIENTVANGEKVSLVGFGTFEPRERAEREGRNPKTGESIHIEAKVAPAFKAGKEFKEKVAK